MSLIPFTFRLTLLEQMLGTAPSNPEVYRKYIQAKRDEAKDVPTEQKASDDEAELLPTLDEELKQGTTVFPRLPTDPSQPIIFDYLVKGFLKEACGSLGRVPGTKSEAIKAYKKVIDGLIFIRPRHLILHLPAGTQIGICERPLRAQTAQGERVALARSETVPAGTWLDVGIILLDEKKLMPLLEELLDYGQLRGLGQWRNSGMGRFEWKRLDGAVR